MLLECRAISLLAEIPLWEDVYVVYRKFLGPNQPLAHKTRADV